MRVWSPPNHATVFRLCDRGERPHVWEPQVAGRGARPPLTSGAAQTARAIRRSSAGDLPGRSRLGIRATAALADAVLALGAEGGAEPARWAVAGAVAKALGKVARQAEEVPGAAPARRAGGFPAISTVDSARAATVAVAADQVAVHRARATRSARATMTARHRTDVRVLTQRACAPNLCQRLLLFVRLTGSSSGCHLTGPQARLASLVDADAAVAVGVDSACLGRTNAAGGVATRVRRAGSVGRAVTAIHVAGRAAGLVGATSPGAGVAGVGRAAVHVGPVLGPRFTARVRHRASPTVGVTRRRRTAVGVDARSGGRARPTSGAQEAVGARKDLAAAVGVATFACGARIGGASRDANDVRARRARRLRLCR